MYNEMFNGMFGKVKPGYCKLSMSGGVAVNTTTGYKSYDVKTGRLTNCTNFVFPGSQDMFFIIPTNNVQVGDIIVVNSTARCVIEAEKNQIKAVNYENSNIETIIPERHVFMGSTYFYGKIVSMFGDFVGKGKGGADKIMKYMMMSEIMGGSGTKNGMFSTGESSNPMNMMMMMSMMGGSNPFGEIFNFSELMGNEDEEETEDEE